MKRIKIICPDCDGGIMRLYPDYFAKIDHFNIDDDSIGFEDPEKASRYEFNDSNADCLWFACNQGCEGHTSNLRDIHEAIKSGEYKTEIQK